jgi:hypothetical protein
MRDRRFHAQRHQSGWRLRLQELSDRQRRKFDFQRHKFERQRCIVDRQQPTAGCNLHEIGIQLCKSRRHRSKAQGARRK